MDGVHVGRGSGSKLKRNHTYTILTSPGRNFVTLKIVTDQGICVPSKRFRSDEAVGSL